MPGERPRCPASRSTVVDLYFMEHRAKVIDIAAFLDRHDRADADTPEDDFRMKAMRDAIAMLIDGQPDRARRVLELLSDHSEDPIDVAGMKGAMGAAPPQGDAT